MKPKTEVRCSVIYEVILKHDNITRAFSDKEYKNLDKKAAPFKRLYKKYINKIIELIEKNTKSKKWTYDFIPIYIVDIPLKDCYVKDGNKKITWKGSGDPITILVMHEYVMLYTLIHELIHINLGIAKQNKWGVEKTENYIHELSEKIYNELGLDSWRKYK